MNRILGYISQYFGNRDLADYPGLLTKPRPKNLDCVIVRASYSVLYDMANEPRTIEWKDL